MVDGRAVVQQGKVQGYLNFAVDRVQVDAPRSRDQAISRSRWCCCNTSLGVALLLCVSRGEFVDLRSVRSLSLRAKSVRRGKELDWSQLFVARQF